VNIQPSIATDRSPTVLQAQSELLELMLDLITHALSRATAASGAGDTIIIASLASTILLISTAPWPCISEQVKADVWNDL
jgi:hypothetical protein